MATEYRLCRQCGSAYGYTVVGKKITYTPGNRCSTCGRDTDTAASSEFGYPELMQSARATLWN